MGVTQQKGIFFESINHIICFKSTTKKTLINHNVSIPIFKRNNLATNNFQQ